MKEIEMDGDTYEGYRMMTEPSPLIGPCWYKHRWVKIKRVGLVDYHRCDRCSARFARQDENSGRMQIDFPWMMKMKDDPE